MHVEVRKKGDVVVADLTGGIVGGLGDEILREVVNGLRAEGWKKTLLNLSGVQAVDSAGFGELVASHKLCNKLGAQLRLLRLPKRVKETLHLAALLPVFHVFEDEKDALHDLAAPAEPSAPG